MSNCNYCLKPLRGKQERFCSLQCAGKGLKELHIKNLEGFAGRKGESCFTWKGDAVSNAGLHKWLRSEIEKPVACVLCGKITTKLDLSNKTGVYDRKFINWWYLCRKCHVNYDKSHIKQWQTRKEKNVPILRNPKSGRFISSTT